MSGFPNTQAAINAAIAAEVARANAAYEPYAGAYGELLTIGQETISRLIAGNNTLTTSSQRLNLNFWTARRTQSLSQVRVLSGGTAAAATPTICRAGLYSVAANGDGTLIGSIPNDTTLFAAQNTTYTRALSVAAPVTLGQRYAWGLLVVSGVAAPTVVGNGAVPSGSATENSISPRLSGVLFGQADLPNGFTEAGLSNTNQLMYVIGLP